MVALVLSASAACEFIRPLAGHPDEVALTVLIIAGQREARMVATHPHREVHETAPKITAILEGPGWEAPFVETGEIRPCKFNPGPYPVDAAWPGPVKCLRATLREDIRPGFAYGIRGSAPLGSFTGRATVPTTPVLIEPRDGLRLYRPNYPDTLRITTRFQVGAEVGTLLAELLGVFETGGDGREVEIGAGVLGTFPQPIEGAEWDTVKIVPRRKPLRFSLRVLGIGWNYTNLANWTGTDPLPRPWPGFGIEGEGAYGYFDGATPSPVKRVVVR